MWHRALWVPALLPLAIAAAARADPPPRLSLTGLYSDTAAHRLAPGVRAFTPRYELWSDGAQKSRFIALPNGARAAVIDSRDMDRWRLPIGTRLWKEFRRDGRRVETRLLWKEREVTPTQEGWQLLTYRWDDAECDATLLIDGQMGARGTDHEIPRQFDCALCHRDMERPLGFTALQLSGPGPGLRLRDLVAAGLLSAPPASTDYTPPGDPTARAALGYLHANCGSCHAADSNVYEEIQMSLRLSFQPLKAVAEAPAYLTTVGQLTQSRRQYLHGRPRLLPGTPDKSMIYTRMGIREVGPESLQMPPLGSHRVDSAGRALIARWISALR